MRPLVLAAALAFAISGPACATGFSAEALARATTPAERIGGPAAMARMQAVRASLVAGHAAWLDPMESRALASAAGQIEGPGGVGLAWFMRGATLRIGAGPGGPVAGFYNPLVDAWLIASLQRIDGEYRIVSARLELASDRDWTASPEPLVAMAAGYSSAMAAFDARFASGGGAPTELPDAFETVSVRTVGWVSGLNRWRADPGQVRAASAALSEIATGQSGRAGATPTIAAQVDALPLNVRRTLAVTAAVTRTSGTSLIVLSPVRPDLILVLDLDNRFRATGLRILNLANMLPGDAG